MKVLAVTGGIGSGKSEVCRILAENGLAVQYNADSRAKALYAECPGLLDEMEASLGCALRDEHGDFVPSRLAAVIFSDSAASGIYPALVTLMLAQITGTEMNLSFYMMLAIVIAVSSLGIAGIPGSATIAVSVVVSGMGLGAYFPLIGGIIAIDPILDMGRTMLNVSGTLISATTVARLNGKLDKQIISGKE